MHTQHGVVRPLPRGAADAVVAVAQDLDAQLVVLLRGCGIQYTIKVFF